MNMLSFMKDLEQRYKITSGLGDRSWYKIWYCKIKPTPIFVLGKNPGGNPTLIAPDGQRMLNGSSHMNAASATYYENDEHDLIDCDWPENRIVGLLVDILQGAPADIRHAVVKTNVTFRRSPSQNALAKYHRLNFGEAIHESDPFLREIIEKVSPRLIILAGVKLEEFIDHHCQHSKRLVQRAERDTRVRKTVFDAAEVSIQGLAPTTAVEVAHASQFSWTCEKYDVASKIRSLLGSDFP